MGKIKFPYRIIRRPFDNIADGKISKDLTIFLKGLCCLLVGLHHYSRIMVEQNGSSNPFYILLASQGGNVGVGIFFFLSGYGLMESSKKKTLSIKEILQKRYWHLIWPILIINLVYILYLKYFKVAEFENNASIILRLLNYTDLDGVLWFIDVLFVCYAIFYIAERIRSERYRNFVFYGLGVGYLIFMMISRPHLHWHYTNIPMFFLGVLYSQLYSTIAEKIKGKYLLIIVGGLIVAVGIGWFGFKLMWARFGVCMLITIAILWLNKRYEIVKQGSTPISNSSYEFYLVHNKILMTLGGVNVVSFLLISIISAGIVHYSFFFIKDIYKKLLN